MTSAISTFLSRVLSSKYPLSRLLSGFEISDVLPVSTNFTLSLTTDSGSATPLGWGEWWGLLGRNRRPLAVIR
jgi:hypothetical protein